MYHFPKKSGRIVAIGYGRIVAVQRLYRGSIEAIYLMYLFYPISMKT